MQYSAEGCRDPQAMLLRGSEALHNAHPSLLLSLRQFAPCPISIPAFTPILQLLGLRLPVAACHECYKHDKKHYKRGHELSHKSRKRLGCWVKLCGRTARYERTSTEVWGEERGRVRCKRLLCLSGCLGSPNNPLWLQTPQAKPQRASKLRTICELVGLHK